MNSNPRAVCGASATVNGSASRPNGWLRHSIVHVLGLFALACAGRVGAQGPGSLLWSSGPGLPSPRAEAVAVLAPDDAVLLLGGVSPASTTVVPKLPDGAASWSAAPDLDVTRIAPGAVRYSPQGILVIGGRTGDQPTDEVLFYDERFGDSQDAAKMSEERQQFAFAADGMGRVYAVGGLGTARQVFSSAERYDPGEDAWASIAPLPLALYAATAVGLDSTDIYLFGGTTLSAVQSKAYRYVIELDSWEEIAPMPLGVRHAVAVLNEGRIYVIGGVSAAGPTAAVQVYDLAAGSWTMDTALPAARYAHGAVLTASGRILVGGGYDAAGVASASVFQTQLLNIPETAPSFGTTPVTTGSLDRPYAYRATAAGNPPPTFSLITAPAGMTVDAGSGAIAWQPGPGQIGVQAVTLRATNRVGFVDQTFDVTVVSDTFPPTAPTEVRVVDVTASGVQLAWSGATDATGVDHYAVYRQYRCGFHGIQRCYALVQGNIPGSNVMIEGLAPLTSYTYAVRAFDAAGHPSPNSMRVTFRTLSPPVSFRFTGATRLPANFPLQLQFFANANPAATFSVVSGPAGLTVDPETGVATWNPSAADVGTHLLVARAANAHGTADLSVELSVRPDAPQLSVVFAPGAGGFRDAVAGAPWTAQVRDGSHTISRYEMVSGPAGMTIDALTGQLSWQPGPDDAGLRGVRVRAINAASSTDITFEFYCHFTGQVSNLQVVGLTDLNPTATWSPPGGTGSDRIAGYTVVGIARYRSGRTYRTQRLTWQTDAETTTVALTGLSSGRSYTLYVNAVDEVDNRGLANAPGLLFVPRPGLPSVGWTIANANGKPGVVADQPAVIQFTDFNSAFGPSLYSPVAVPSGFTLDPATGEGRWTPSPEDVGTVPVTVRVTNQIGSRDVLVNVVVNFSGPVLEAVAARSGSSATVRWQPPDDYVFPVAGYRVTMHWQVNGRSYSRPMNATGTVLDFELVPTGAVWHKGVTITPLDATGRSGVTSALIPYNGALPAGLPPADPAWIDSVMVGADGTPVVSVRGPVGAVAEVEVSSDLVNWDPFETIVLADEGMQSCPDPASQNLPSGFYRIKAP